MLLKLVFRIFPFLVLFTPNKYFEVYYISILLPVIFSFFNFKIPKRELVFFIFLAIFLSLRFLFYPGYDDLKEYFKIFFFILMVLFLRKSSFELKKYFLVALIGFLIVNFISSLLIFFKFNDSLILFIKEYYTSESQLDLFDRDSVRSTGLMSGVGQQGVFFLFTFFFFLKLYIKKKNKYFLPMIFISVAGLLFSQSKTSLFGLVFWFFLLFFFGLSYRHKFMSIGFILVLVLNFNGNYDYLFVFREYYLLLDSDSVLIEYMMPRIDNWEVLTSPLVNNPFFFLIGCGRNYLNELNIKSSVFDSDILYVAINFGLIGVIVFIKILYVALKKFKFFRKELLSIVVVSFALNVFTEPKLFLLLFLGVSYLNQLHYHDEKCLDIN